MFSYWSNNTEGTAHWRPVRNGVNLHNSDKNSSLSSAQIDKWERDKAISEILVLAAVSQCSRCFTEWCANMKLIWGNIEYSIDCYCSMLFQVSAPRLYCNNSQHGSPGAFHSLPTISLFRRLIRDWAFGILSHVMNWYSSGRILELQNTEQFQGSEEALFPVSQMNAKLFSVVNRFNNVSHPLQLRYLSPSESKW